MERITEQKIKWDADVNGKSWISEDAAGSWMVTGIDRDGKRCSMYGVGSYSYKTPMEALREVKKSKDIFGKI